MVSRAELLAQWEESCSGGEREAVAFLKSHAWLLMPDVKASRLANRSQRIFAEVSLGDSYRVDFALYYIESREVYWEFVEVQSPDARIVGSSAGYLAGMNEALRQIDEWEDWFARAGSSIDQRFPNASRRRAYRILIGRSDRLSAVERESYQRLRRDHLRIRTFYSLYEKINRFTDAELDELETHARPYSQHDLKRESFEISQLMNVAGGPAVPNKPLNPTGDKPAI